MSERAPTPAVALSALLDPARLMVAGALVGTSRSTSDIAEYTGLDREGVLRALGDLRQAGLVEHDGDSYTLPTDRLHRLATAAAEADVPMDPSIGFGMTDDERGVLARFFQGRTLAEIPSNRAKRLVVLERLALEFDLGRRYPERAVDDVLAAFHPDCPALRRYLVDEGFLDRADGQYWRSGGRLDHASG